MRDCVRAGEDIPERIANAPELRLGLLLYIQAFFDLDSTRDYGKAISWLAIRDYSGYYELDAEQEEALVYHIRKMDTAYLERLSKENKKRSGKNK